MININTDLHKTKSLLGRYWKLEECDERLILSYSQKNNIPSLLARLLLIRKININYVKDFLNPSIESNLPNPFLLKDMSRGVNRVISAINNFENIGIIADYDVDGSTSASILFKFLNLFTNKIFIKTPNRLIEGYGPNLRIMDEMFDQNINLILTLDCGTTSFDIIDNKKYSHIDVIVIDHHLSEEIFPNIYALINPNRHDEDSKFDQMAAVGITFLFIMALRKNLREINFFNIKFKEPNILSLLDLVALGTVCDVVKLTNYNRSFVKIGLDLIKKRNNKAISTIIDNANLNSTPTSSDLGFLVGPQLNAASRVDDSSLPFKYLTSNNILDIDSISKKLSLLNQKRKLIENIVFQEALVQANKQNDQNFILVYGSDWHKGVLGIVASRLMNEFYKPVIVISFEGSLGVGSARSIHSIDLGNIILNAKHQNILIGGGGHKMAAGLKIHTNLLNDFILYLKDNFKNMKKNIFKKIQIFDSILSINKINDNFLEIIDQMEPFGSGNPEPNFILEDVKIESIRIIKEKHMLIFFQNDFSIHLKAICFNCIGTKLGDYLLNFKNNNLILGCNIKRDSYKDLSSPKITIIDAMISN